MGIALVTGASSGLGKEFAKLFANDGHDVILVARTEARLRALAAEIVNVKAHVVVADLGAPDGPKRVFDEVTVRGLEVDFLVNSAGFGSNGAFLDLDVARELEMIRVNCAALVELTHHFARGMRERRRGRILNIASTAGFQPGPFMATYYASKSFVVMFSEALAHELKDAGVTVTVECPGAVATEFSTISGNDKAKLFTEGPVASAVDVAQHAYAAMMRGQVVAIPGARNWILMELAQRLGPRAIVRSIAARYNKP
jgi:short-subunit dehydrogenase